MGHRSVESRGFNKVEADVLAKLDVLPQVEKTLSFVAEGCKATEHVLSVGVGLCVVVPGSGKDECVFVVAVLTWDWAPPENRVYSMGRTPCRKSWQTNLNQKSREA